MNTKVLEGKMPKKFTILINDEDVVKTLNKLPQRGKGLYITQAIQEKICREKGLYWDEKKIKEIIALEVEQILRNK